LRPERERRRRPRAVLLVTLVAAFVAGCGKNAASADAGALAGDGAVSANGADAAEPMDPREAAAWEAARGGEQEELMRLVDLVGCDRLHELAERPELRATAIAAAGYCGDFSELPWLARLGVRGNDADAQGALGAVVELAARPRRSTDPEDAEELHEGCEELLRLARDVGQPRERRVLAIRGLRMLSERGCVKRADIPGDLDAK
jgi:hypothetical protein